MTENPANTTGPEPEEKALHPISEALQRDIDKYREKLAADPSSLAFLPLAESLRKAGQLQEALEICRQGLEKHPDHISGQVAMAKILLDLEDQSGARDILEKVIEDTPDHLLANKLLGQLYLQSGEKDKARQRLTIVVMLNSTDEEAVEALKTLELVTAGEPQIPKPQAPEAGPTVDQIPEEENREDVSHLQPPPAGGVAEEEPLETEVTGEKELSPEINTETLADLYMSQDLPEKAINIYRGLLADDPDNETLKMKLQKALALQGGEREDAKAAQSPSEEENSRQRNQIVRLEKWLRSIREKRGGIQ